MTLTKYLAGAACAALAFSAAPAAAQYATPYNAYAYSQYTTPYANSYSQYATPYSNPYSAYGTQYGYNPYGYRTNAAATQMATQQCSAAVQSRLSNRNSLSGILGAFLGTNTSTGRIVSYTRVNERRNGIRVAGLASSGANYGYGRYGAGAYGALGYGYQPDLKFTCDVDYSGRVRSVDLKRR